MKKHAAIMLRNNEGKFLFVKRLDNVKTLPSAWTFPSGTVEEGESTINTMLREAKEELGVSIHSSELISEIELPEFDVKLYFFMSDNYEGTPTMLATDEMQAIEWMSFDEFFSKFTDEEIGHGLVKLRNDPVLDKFRNNK